LQKVAKAALFLTFMAGALFCVGLIPSARNDGKT
jgi:hypothetical protein